MCYGEAPLSTAILFPAARPYTVLCTRVYSNSTHTAVELHLCLSRTTASRRVSRLACLRCRSVHCTRLSFTSLNEDTHPEPALQLYRDPESTRTHTHDSRALADFLLYGTALFSLSTVHRASSVGLRTPCRASWTGGRPSGPPCASGPCQLGSSATRA